MDWLLAIDGGGTGCRAALADPAGAVRGRGAGGAANVSTDFAGALSSIRAATDIALRDAGVSPDAVSRLDAVLGLAGTNVGGAKARVLAELPFRRAHIVSDSLTALEGALGDGDGAIAIVGTGSIFTARRDGRLRTIGGWGLGLGDWGGGARIGKQLLEETLLAHDDIRPGSALTDAVLSRFEGDARRVVQFANTALPKDFGAFAPLVVEAEAAGDETARRVLAKAVADLAEALRALRLLPGERLCLLGGLAGLFEPRLGREFSPFLRAPLGDALAGGLRIGRRMWAGRAGEGA